MRRIFGQSVDQLLLCSIPTEAIIADLKLELQLALYFKAAVTGKAVAVRHSTQAS